METEKNDTPTQGDCKAMPTAFPEDQLDRRAWWLDLAEHYLKAAEFAPLYSADARRCLDNARALAPVWS